MNLTEAKRVVFGELGRLIRYLDSDEEISNVYRYKLKERINVLQIQADLLAQITVGKDATPVYQYTTKSEFVGKYPSIEIAAAFNGIPVKGLSQSFYKRRKTYKGFVWKLEGESVGLDLDSIRNKFSYQQREALIKIDQEGTGSRLDTSPIDPKAKR